jgi:hypothetical protein
MDQGTPQPGRPEDLPFPNVSDALRKDLATRFRNGIEPKMQVRIKAAARGSSKALKGDHGRMVFEIACSLQERLKPYGIVGGRLDEHVVKFFAYFCRSQTTSLEVAWEKYRER